MFIILYMNVITKTGWAYYTLDVYTYYIDLFFTSYISHYKGPKYNYELSPSKEHYSTYEAIKRQENKARSYPKHYSKTGQQPFSLVTSCWQETGTYLLEKKSIYHFIVLFAVKSEENSP